MKKVFTNYNKTDLIYMYKIIIDYSKTKISYRKQCGNIIFEWSLINYCGAGFEKKNCTDIRHKIFTNTFLDIVIAFRKMYFQNVKLKQFL